MKRSHFNILDSSDDENEYSNKGGLLASAGRNARIRPRHEHQQMNRDVVDFTDNDSIMDIEAGDKYIRGMVVPTPPQMQCVCPTPNASLTLADIDLHPIVRGTLRSLSKQPENIAALLFAAANAPTSHSRFTRSWIYIYNYSLLRPASMWIGKWMWFVSPKYLDDAFIAVAAALDTCHLGSTVKTAPPANSTSAVPIIIYTDDYRNRDDVLRIGLVVQSLSESKITISYKPDVFTLHDDGIHGSNTLRYSTIYQLKRESRELTLVDNGLALECALRMSSDSVCR